MLLKEQHPNQDFFVADIFDNLPFKDDMASMEHPIFVLSKKKDVRNLVYHNGNITISIKPTTDGLPTIFDKDILLYCASLLMQEVNAGRTPPKKIRISCHDLLVATNRPTDGHGYKNLKAALDRLSGVRIKTNIKTNNNEFTEAFGMIDSYRVIESSRVKDRMVRLEITLSEWFYNSIIGKEVLTINRDYFRLGKPMERRLYEIARKHCGNQRQWAISLIPLMEKTGSTSTLRLFRSRLKTIIEHDHLPDYSMSLDDNDIVTFYRVASDIKNQGELPLVDRSILADIKGETVIRARGLVEGTEWEFNTIIEQWSQHMGKHGTPDNINGALIGFVKKKIKAACVKKNHPP